MLSKRFTERFDYDLVYHEVILPWHQTMIRAHQDMIPTLTDPPTVRSSSQNSNPVLFDEDLLPLIIGCLKNPQDVEAARLVCRSWRQIYSVKKIIRDIEKHDPCLWKKLTTIAKLIDKTEGTAQINISEILIVQRYDSKEDYQPVDSAVCVFDRNFKAQCKTKIQYAHIEVEKKHEKQKTERNNIKRQNNSLFIIGEDSFGMTLTCEKMAELRENNICYLKGASDAVPVERVIAISLKELWTIIQVANPHQS